MDLFRYLSRENIELSFRSHLLSINPTQTSFHRLLLQAEGPCAFSNITIVEKLE